MRSSSAGSTAWRAAHRSGRSERGPSRPRASVLRHPPLHLLDPAHLSKSTFLTVVGVLLLGAPIQAQDTAAAAIDSNITILDLIIDPTVNEPYRVFLAKGVVYGASFSQPGVSIRMRSYAGKQLPFVVALSQLEDASGRSEFEIYPQSDGEIEFLAVFTAIDAPARFHLWRDARATARGQRSAAEGFWEIGVEAFVAHLGRPSVDGDPIGESGTSYGGCFSFRNGPGVLGRLNGCAFGMEVTSGEGEVIDRSRFFIEPRFRLTRGRSDHAGWAPEAGVLVVFGASEQGVNLGTGLYGALDYRNMMGRGMRVLLMARTDHTKGDVFKDILHPEFGTEEVGIWTPSLRFGAGYYW